MTSDFEPLSDISPDLETSLEIAGTSQATFSQSVKAKIRATYDYRCVICLSYVSTSQCVHIIDAATAGWQQLLELGVLPDDYERNAETNGMVLCPNCHSYFTVNDIVLSLPIPVLKYLEQYVAYTPKANRKPLYEIFSLLVDASLGVAVELPDVKPILPYIGLFTIVTLKPAQVTGCTILTPYLPSVSTIRGSKFVKVVSNTRLTAKNAARIFHSNIINNDMPLYIGEIPLSPQDPAFTERRFWRLPVSPAAIFAALIQQLAYDPSKCEDIRLARSIRNILDSQSINAYPPDEADPNGGSGPSGGDGLSGGSGPSGGGGRGGYEFKRKNTGSSPSSGKGKKKARKASSGGGGGTGDCGEPSKASDFSPKARSQNKQSHHREIGTASSPNMEAPAALIDAGWNDTDSESGRSVSAISPPEKDDPATWSFGPSFSTNKIVFTATAVNLTL